MPYPPSANNLYYTHSGRRHLSSEGRRFKAAAAASAVAAGQQAVTGPVAVRVRVYRPRRAGDLDNTLKAVLDSLTGVAWRDDSQVCRIEADRHEDKARPRVEIEVLALFDVPEE